MSEKHFRRVNVLGVQIDDLPMDQAVKQVAEWIQKGGKQSLRPYGLKHYIVTPNPEFVMAAQKDKEFQKVLNNADLAIPDGVGLKIGSDLQNTISGVDLLERLCKEAAEKGFTTGFLGGRGKVAEKTAECLKKKYTGLKVVFAEDGGEVDSDGESLGVLSPPAVDILFVAFGQVKQEKWIANNLERLPVKVAMGVGGAFDYLSGRVPRAPKWMRDLGLEWLFRIVIQPWRIKRQLVLVKFVWLVMVGKLGS